MGELFLEQMITLDRYLYKKIQASGKCSGAFRQPAFGINLFISWLT
jgi:hypothetical protein